MSAASQANAREVTVPGGFRDRSFFSWLNVAGGLLVLGSYVWGFAAQPQAMGALWGGVPESLRPLYTVNMFLAAGGYLVFTSYLFFSVAGGAVRVETGRARLRTFSLFYGLVLIPSALWLPLTALLIESPSAWLWVLVRIDLAAVALGTLGIAMLTVTLDAPRTRWRLAAIAALIPFGLQTVVLDALVWPAYFPSVTP